MCDVHNVEGICTVLIENTAKVNKTNEQYEVIHSTSTSCDVISFLVSYFVKLN